MGFGSFITDAAGKLHDISKSAFDTYGMKHQGRFDPGFQKLQKGGFVEGVSQPGTAGVLGVHRLAGDAEATRRRGR